MDRETYNLFQLGTDKETRLWKEALFVFDSSALLDLYSYPEPTRKKFFNDIIGKLKDRVWIPSHVEYEFLKNRNNTIRKSFSEYYAPLRDELKRNTDEFTKTKNLLDQLKQRIGSPSKHPYIEGIDFNSLQADLVKTLESYRKLEDAFKAKLLDVEKEILDLEENDTVLDRIEKLFPVGTPYSTDEIIELINVGKIRYEFKIPPGYEDAKEKEGTQIFGDLIVWKQLLDFAKKTKKAVVFITNDLKSDWWNYLDKNRRNKAPRDELIKELHDQAGCEFWMYDQLQFMHNANIYLKSSLTADELGLVSSLFGEYRNDADTLSYRCDNCKRSNHISRTELNLDFDLVGGSEKQIGEENIYQATSHFKCDYCHLDIHGVFNIYEYPVGVKNNQSIDLDGASVIRECALNLRFLSSENDNEIDGIEDILYEYISDESPDELMILSGNTSIEEVNDVNISSINLEKDGTIHVKGTGEVSVKLNYGSSSDGATSSDYFPFKFEAILTKSENGYELEEMISLEIDNSSFYR